MTGEGERMVRVNGADLCVESFGDPAGPAILLVMGAAGSMDYWEDEFCERLAAAGRFVIRYDHRDTGRSTSSEPGKPTYTGSDLVADAAGVLDALDRTPAHVVGVSMGGAMAQVLALRYPDRVASLTLISTSAAVPLDCELPPMSDVLRSLFESPPADPDWTDRAAVVDHLVEGERPFLGPVHGDLATKRELAGRIFDRACNVASSQNHWIIDDGEPTEGELADITLPTLVLHGTHDPLFPPGHAEALADAIAGSRLVMLDGVGHEVPPRSVWDVVISELVDHTAAGEGDS